MTAPKDLQRRLERHLKEEGFHLNSGPAGIERQLKCLMGSERYEDYLCGSDSRQTGDSGIASIYRTVQTKEEANLLFSHQAKVMLAASAWIGMKVIGGERHKPSRVADMGCASGTLCGWLAKELPGTEVVGFDREDNFVKIAGGTPGPSTFHRWDYGSTELPPEDGFDVVVTGLGIDFPDHERRSVLGIHSNRDTPRHAFYRDKLGLVFRNWRSAAKDNARMWAVLRIPDVEMFIGIVDAAAAAGWTIDIGECSWSVTPGERMPALAFTAAATAAEPPVPSTGRSTPRRLWRRPMNATTTAMSCGIISRSPARSWLNTWRPQPDTPS